VSHKQTADDPFLDFLLHVLGRVPVTDRAAWIECQMPKTFAMLSARADWSALSLGTSSGDGSIARPAANGASEGRGRASLREARPVGDPLPAARSRAGIGAENFFR
jgi:hypothetical protein